MSERGKEFTFKQEIKIIPGTTPKRVILEAYGNPTSESIVGKYQVLEYFYVRESLTHGRAIGQGILGAATMGLSNLAVDHGVKKSDVKREFKEMRVYVDPVSGIVKDFYYHDSELNGHDESESIYLKCNSIKAKGAKLEEQRAMLEKAISLNPQNHRALNNLAWMLIDNNIDLDQGVGYAERAVQIFPDSPYNNGTLGIGCFKKGDKEKAEKYLQKAIELYPIYSPKDQRALQHDKAILATIRQ
jgi:tetratricopeptide (TPR) repeat protein